MKCAWPADSIHVIPGLDPGISIRERDPMHGGHVYILTNRQDGTLYVGVTSALARRIWEHREGFVEGFSKTYNLKRLVYFEGHGSIRDAVQRERSLKHWSRKWKVELIVSKNPEWRDLYEEIL